MKTLILTDDAFAQILPKIKADLGRAEAKAPTLPSAEELHTIVRGDGTPLAFRAQRERLDAATDAVADMRDGMHELIRAAHARGVGPAWLARWSGYDPSRIYQILNGE